MNKKPADVQPPAGDEEVMEGREPMIPQLDLKDDHVLIGLRLGNLAWWIANGSLPTKEKK